MGHCLNDLCGEFQDPRDDETGQCRPRRLKLSCDLPLLYTNDTAQQCIDTCPDGLIGEPITVTIGEGIVSSPFSTANANDLAEVEACRQAAALRALTPCLYPSTEQTCINECPEGAIGEPISVTVSAGDFQAETQEEANALALAEACAQAAALRAESPCETDEPEEPDPEAAISFSSIRRTGTLIGIPEYTDPSVPPKKYRIQTLDGESCDHDYRSGPSGVANQCDFANETTLANGSREAFAGTYEFDAITAVETNNQEYWFGPGHPCHVVTLVLQPEPPPIDISPLGCTGMTPEGLYTGTIDMTIEKTHCSWFYTGTCFVISDIDNFGFPLYTGRVITGEITKDLSDEDTEEDAYARGDLEEGTSNIAKLKVRGAGDFDVEEVIVTIQIACSGLISGRDYEVTLPIVTEDYAGGNPVESERTYNFTASGATEDVVDVVEADPAKRVTIGTPTIELLP